MAAIEMFYSRAGTLTIGTSQGYSTGDLVWCPPSSTDSVAVMPRPESPAERRCRLALEGTRMACRSRGLDGCPVFLNASTTALCASAEHAAARGP